MNHRIKTFVIIVMAGFVFACGSKNPRPLNFMPKQDQSEMLMNQGIYLLRNNQLDDAEVKLKQALQGNSNLQVAWNTLGIVYIYKRDFPKAIETFEHLLKLNPEFYDAYNSLGAIYMEMENYEKAKENLLIAANAKDFLMPESAYTNLAILEIRQNRIDSAMRYVSKGLSLNKQYSPLYALKGNCLERMGNINEALINYDKSLQFTKDPDVQLMLTIGRAFIKVKNKAKALDLLEKALSKAKEEQIKQEILEAIRDAEAIR